jgi:hypothetical protein
MALVRADVSEKLTSSKIRVKISELRTLLNTANVVHSLMIPVTLMMEAIRSSETSDLTRATRRHHIPKDRHLHCYRLEDIKSYIALTGWAL